MRILIAAITCCLMLIFSSGQAWSQARKGINYTEIGGLLHSSNTAGNNSRFNGFRARTGITRIIKEHFGAGIALGTDNYRRSTGESYNTLPITANGSYFFNPDFSGLKLDIYGGYSPRLFDNLNRGFTAGAGIAYSFPVTPGMNLGLQTGYNYQQIDFPSRFVQTRFNLGSVRLGLGITFK